jgi:hypothetical protein
MHPDHPSAESIRATQTIGHIDILPPTLYVGSEMIQVNLDQPDTRGWR